MPTKRKPPTYNGHMGVVSRYDPRVRHITLTTKNAKPICGFDNYMTWKVGTSHNVHKLPLCKGCTKMAEKISRLLHEDFGYVDKDTLMETKRAEFAALLADIESD